jgi:glutaconate CoA-transferase subunit B
VKVITDKCFLEPDPETGEMELSALYPGATVETSRPTWAGSCESRDPLGTVEPPSAAEVKLLREKLDPDRLHIK